MIKQVLYKQIFLVPIICGALMQCLKVLVYFIADKKISIGKFVQADGMPNLHAVVFGSLSTAVAIKYGYSSILFSLTTTYGVIIIHDTMRLKGEKGKQANVINEIVSNVIGRAEIAAGKGLRVLSFEPFDVMCGALLGIIGAYMLL